MKSKSLFTAVTALSMVFASTASATVATPLTRTAITQPATETVDGENAGRGNGSSIIVLVLALAAIAAGIWAATNGSSRPNSP